MDTTYTLTLNRIVGCSVYDLLSAIAQARRDTRVSQKRVGELLGVSRQTISNWERRRATPGACHLLALCAMFGINPLDETHFRMDSTATWADGYQGEPATHTVHALELTQLLSNRTLIIE